MAIQRVEVRARIVVGSLSISTPYVQSFNVRLQRGQLSSFDATLKISHDEVNSSITGDNIKIYAGSKASGIDLIYTGIVRNAKISPCFDDPKYVILNVGGSDILSTLNGKKYTRRCRSTRATWVAITSVSRRGLKSGKFAYHNEPVIDINHGQLNADNPNTYYNAETPATNINPTQVNSGITADSVPLRVEIQTPRASDTEEEENDGFNL